MSNSDHRIARETMGQQSLSPSHCSMSQTHIRVHQSSSAFSYVIWQHGNAVRYGRLYEM